MPSGLPVIRYSIASTPFFRIFSGSRCWNAFIASSTEFAPRWLFSLRRAGSALGYSGHEGMFEGAAHGDSGFELCVRRIAKAIRGSEVKVLPPSQRMWTHYIQFYGLRPPNCPLDPRCG